MTSEEDERGFFGEARLQPAEPTRTEKPHYHGHRERLRARFLEAGQDSLADYEMLELILFRAFRQGDTKPLAKALIARFGSLAEVLGAPVHLLREVKGIGQAAALELKIIAAAAQRMAKSGIKGRQVLTSWSQVIDYCRTSMAFETIEQFRILFLDK
ncbi:MAG: hypothetical protein L0I29_20275, partial [Hyphomicrobiales bacterium]|nr:hypothetical protein [Hyphomicrobiales bacterium]